jgi:N-acetylneuraminate synthase
MGNSHKQVAENESETVIIQRRCLRAGRDIEKGERITREMIDVLRPATPGAILPYEIDHVVGTRSIINIPTGKELRWTDLSS